MFDFSFGELAVIGAVALVVLGPERLPKVARTVGEWAGKAQRYVAQVKGDITRELEVAELKKLQEQARDMARSVETSVQGAVSDFKSGLDASAIGSTSQIDSALTSQTPALPGETNTGASDYSWEGAGDSWQSYRFQRRYKPGPSVDELYEEIGRLKRQLAMPETPNRGRQKYAPRARMNRPRIRR